MNLGKKGEEGAACYLIKKEYRMVEMNYRCKAGEIDLIMKDDKTLVFVEVKARSGLAFGFPGESITREKKSRIKKCVNYYVSTHRICNQDLRIDVVEVLFIGGRYYFHHIENAF